MTTASVREPDWWFADPEAGTSVPRPWGYSHFLAAGGTHEQAVALARQNPQGHLQLESGAALLASGWSFDDLLALDAQGAWFLDVVFAASSGLSQEHILQISSVSGSLSGVPLLAETGVPFEQILQLASQGVDLQGAANLIAGPSGRDNGHTPKPGLTLDAVTTLHDAGADLQAAHELIRSGMSEDDVTSLVQQGHDLQQAATRVHCGKSPVPMRIRISRAVRTPDRGQSR